MDIVAIVLIFMKKWKPALIVSIIGSVLMLFLIPTIPFWWVSGILYLISILVSVNGLMKAQDNPSIVSDSSSESIENKLLKLEDLLERGVISRNEYDKSRSKILGIDSFE